MLTLATFSNKDAASGYRQHTIGLNTYKGQTLQININGVEDNREQTPFVLDDVTVTVQ